MSLLHTPASTGVVHMFCVLPPTHAILLDLANLPASNAALMLRDVTQVAWLRVYNPTLPPYSGRSCCQSPWVSLCTFIVVVCTVLFASTEHWLGTGGGADTSFPSTLVRTHNDES